MTRNLDNNYLLKDIMKNQQLTNDQSNIILKNINNIDSERQKLYLPEGKKTNLEINNLLDSDLQKLGLLSHYEKKRDVKNREEQYHLLAKKIEYYVKKYENADLENISLKEKQNIKETLLFFRNTRQKLDLQIKYLEQVESCANGNFSLIDKCVKYHLKDGLDYDELFQEGYIALLAAIEKYDITKGSNFTSYATLWVSQRIARIATYNSKVMRPTCQTRDEINLLEEITNKLELVLGNELTIEDVAKYIFQDKELLKKFEFGKNAFQNFAIFLKYLKKLKPLSNREFISLAEVKLEEENNLSECFYDLAEGPEECAINLVQKANLKYLLSINTLKTREKMITIMHSGLRMQDYLAIDEIKKIASSSSEHFRELLVAYLKKPHKYTRKEISEMFSISVSRTGQLNEKSLKKLKYQIKHTKLI